MPDNNINIPGYDIYEQIGKGGMASVYRAKQHTFDRNVALKILHSNLSDDGNFSQRFLMESMIIAKLHHSHIVHVYDVGEIHGHHYIAMEFLSGSSLHERLKEGVSLKEILTITEQMASALDYAHQKGIVHRDIKPDNVMFRDDGAAVLTDFGIAKDTDTDVTLTQVGSVIGTPKYMSPEQIRGADVKPVSDIYSLGIVFYQMLTGSVPYKGEDIVATAYMHINDPVPVLPPSLQRFQAIINRMLAKQGSDRFQRGNEVVAALKRCESEASAVGETVEGTVDLLTSEGEISGVNAMSGASLDLSINKEKPSFYRKKWQWGFIVLFLVVIGFGFFILKENSKSIQDASVKDMAVISELLMAADKNIEQLNLKRPSNDNAYDKYQQILTLDPGNQSAAEGVQRIVARYVQLAHDAKDKNDWEKTRRYLDEALLIDPSLQDIDELNQYLAMKESEKKVEDSQRKKSIVNLGLELQIEGLLQSAARDEREGRLSGPVGNNAKEKYERILSLDPGNVVAREKLERIVKL